MKKPASNRLRAEGGEARHRAKVRQRQRLFFEHAAFLKEALGPVLPAGPTRHAIIVTICHALGRTDLTIRKAPKP